MLFRMTYFLEILCVRIGIRRIVETVSADADHELSHRRGEMGSAIWLKRVKIPKRKAQIGEAISRDRPIGDIVMPLLRAHVVDVLKIVASADGFLHAVKLPGLVNDRSDCWLQPSVFTVCNVDPIHHDAGHGFHPGVSFAARLTLDDSR